MSNQSAGSTSSGKKSFKSKFKFKNGLKSFKKSVKKNDTVQHFTGTPEQQDASAEDMSNFYYVSPDAKNGKKKKKKSHRLPRLKISEYTFPTQIKTPSESWGEAQYDETDRKLHDYLNTKYQNTIYKLKFFPSDILIRFAISQRAIANYEARKEETENHFKTYLNYHETNHYDDVLTNELLNSYKSLSSLTDDMNALPLFIYGQDKEGHPIFWDDGSAYGKKANLDMFKKDMKRVGLFRARLMKRMHNIKLHSSKKYGKMIYKHCLVMDLDQFNAKKFVKDRKFHEQNTKDISDLFPEVLHRLYIINAPWAFRSAWKIIQSFLHPITVQKTKILGKDYIEELVKDIEIEMIPYKFGGRGPWTVMYGEGPLSYPLKTSDIEFDYKSLPKPTDNAPPRTPPAKKKTHDDEKKDDGYPDININQLSSQNKTRSQSVPAQSHVNGIDIAVNINKNDSNTVEKKEEE